jgi:serine/threonine-protein kinase
VAPTADLRERLQSALGTNYSLERELGGGGMSRLFLATERSLERQVVVKLLPPELASEVSAERFRREMLVTAKLRHPHILPVLSAGAKDGLLFYVTPYVAGESLRHRLARERRLPVVEAVRVLREVADALAFAHAHDVVHRDLKPANVLLDGEHALLADFGVARALAEATAAGATGAGGERLTSTGVALGTPGYMAPEQLSGDPSVDARADVYALAVVGYEMLAGAMPFAGATPRAVLAAQFTGPPRAIAELRPDVPASLADALARALVSDPEGRLASAAALREALDHVEGGTTARPEFTRKALPARRATRIALAVGVVAAVGLLAVLVPRYTGRPAVTSGQRAAPADAEAAIPGEATTPRTPVTVVAPFVNRTGNAALTPLGDMVADWVSQGLTRTGLVQVVDARAALGALQQGARGADGGRPSEAARLRTLAREAGAEVVVSGAYDRDGDSLRFQAQVTEARTGRLLRAVDPVVGDARRPTTALDRVRQQVTGALSTLYDPRLAGMASTAMRPPSYEAYEAFMRGVALELDQHDMAAALPYYVRAAALDPGFATAHIWAIFGFINVGEPTRADSVARVLAASRERLVPYDRVHLEHYEAWLRGDWPAALRAAREMTRLAPTSQEALVVRANAAAALNRPREAAALWARAGYDRGLFAGSGGGYRAYAGMLHMAGEHRQELRVVVAARRRYPDDPELLVGACVAHAALGATESARACVDTLAALASRADHHVPAGWLVTHVARELRAHGQRAAAARVLEPVIRDRRAGPAAADDSGQLELDRHAFYLAEQWGDARPIIQRLAAARPGGVADQGFLGVMAARDGARADAVRVSTWLAAQKRPYLWGEHTYWRARIAALLGGRDEAVRLLRQALAEGFTFDPSIHTQTDFESLRGYTPFDVLLAPQG